jgi:hypothetical protein
MTIEEKPVERQAAKRERDKVPKLFAGHTILPDALAIAAFMLYSAAERVLKEPGDQAALRALGYAHEAFAKAEAELAERGAT